MTVSDGGKRPATTTYLTMRAPSHPLAHADGVVRVHRAVLYDAIGPGVHECHWCGQVLTWGESLVVDHVDEDTWNNSPENLVPSCRGCNGTRPSVHHTEADRGPTHCKNGHEFNAENTYWRKKTSAKSGFSRQCRACSRDRKRADQAAHPKRVQVSVPLRGMTLDLLREFVRETAELNGGTPVSMTYRNPE